MGGTYAIDITLLILICESDALYNVYDFRTEVSEIQAINNAVPYGNLCVAGVGT